METGKVNMSIHSKREELRVYKVPDFVFEQERGILKKYGVDDWRGLLGLVYDELALISMFMINIDPGFECDGLSFRKVGSRIEKSIKLLDAVCGLLADFELLDNAQDDGLLQNGATCFGA